MLPLPYIKAGWLKISPPGKPLAPHCDWMLFWFVLDYESLYERWRKWSGSLWHYSRCGVYAESSTSNLPARPSLLRIAVEDIVHMAPSVDLNHEFVVIFGCPYLFFSISESFVAKFSWLFFTSYCFGSIKYVQVVEEERGMKYF